MRPVEKIFFVSLNNIPVSILSPLDPIVAVLGTLAVEVESLCKVYLCKVMEKISLLQTGNA